MFNEIRINEDLKKIWAYPDWYNLNQKENGFEFAQKVLKSDYFYT